MSGNQRNHKDEVFHSPLRLGQLAGRYGDPLPLKMGFRVGPNDEEVVATFYLVRGWDAKLQVELAEAGLSPDIGEEDLQKLYAQNVFVMQVILDRQKAWENLPRDDGSLWKYQAPSMENVGTDKDPRVQLAAFGPIASMLKMRSINAATSFFRERDAKNSENSSEPATGPKRKLGPKPTDSSAN